MIIDHKKNTAFELAFPMVDSASPESFKSGVTVADTAYYKDGAGAWTALAIADAVAEIGATGMYQISLTAGELNHDWVVIKFTGSGVADTLVTFRMHSRNLDDVGLIISPKKMVNNKADGTTKVYEEDGVTVRETHVLQAGSSDDEVELVRQ